MATTDLLFQDFAAAYALPPQAGNIIASTICPEPPYHDPGRLYNFKNSLNQYSVRTDLQYKLQYNPAIRLDKKEAAAWVDVFTVYHKFVVSLLAAEESQNLSREKEADWPKVYEDWKDVVNALYRGYQNNIFAAWTIPCLYVAGKYLRIFAIKADDKIASQRDSGLAFGGIDDEDAFDPSSKNEKLEDAARQINRIFGLCIGDRLMEDYSTAEKYLTDAYTMCHKDARKNLQLILTYLIPTKLLTSHMLPSPNLLSQHGALARLFQPVCDAIKTANLAALNAALENGEDEFVKRRIYLTLERGRDVILRNVFRKVFLAGGFEPAKDSGAAQVRRTRIPLKEFAAALQLAGAEVGDGDGGIDYDEVECLIANAIYKNLMKGYIARERATVVLSKGGAFPGTGV